MLREALTDDIHASHPGTWGMICMATHCWWPYMHRELIVKATECKPCTVIDEETVMPEEILPDDKWISGYRSDIEVEKGMTRATTEASARERASTDGESRFLKTKAIRPIPLKERSVELNLARKIHGKRRSKKKLEGLYEVLAPGSHILKVSPTTSTIKEPGKQIVTVRNSDIAKFGTHQERQTPLKVYADRRGPRAGEKVVQELIHSHIKEFTRKQKGDKKMKHRKREPGSGVSSQRSNISRAMRGRVAKIAKLRRNPKRSTSTRDQRTDYNAPTDPPATASSKRSSDRNRRSPSYYGFETSSPGSDILTPPKRPRRAGDVENFAPPVTVVESVQHILEIQPEEQNVSPHIGSVSPPAVRNVPLLETDTPTLARSMTALDAEEQDYENEDWTL